MLVIYSQCLAFDSANCIHKNCGNQIIMIHKTCKNHKRLFFTELIFYNNSKESLSFFVKGTRVMRSPGLAYKNTWSLQLSMWPTVIISQMPDTHCTAVPDKR